MFDSNRKQVGGDHYQSSIQTWDYIIAHDLGYLEGNVIKYVTRHRKKNGMQDLEKALHYLQKLIEVEDARLQRTQARDSQTGQGNAQTTLRTFIRGGFKESRADASREQTSDKCDQGTYQPKSLRDII